MAHPSRLFYSVLRISARLYDTTQIDQCRVTGFAFPGGRLTNDGSHSYNYDAESRIVSVDGGSTATYVYDAEGRRVQKSAGGVTTEYLHDLSGGVVVEYQGGGWSKVYSYLNGGLVSQYVSGGTTYFALNDHLGSTRVLTDMTPTVADALDFAPFGEQIAGGSTSSHKFTGYERDPESSLDNAQARYYSSAQGRFMSSDPFAGDIGNPQSLNRYAYVLNTPIALIDPTGMIGEGEGCEEMGTCGCDPDFGCGGGDGPDFGNWPFPSPSPIYDPPPDTSSSNPSAGDPRSQRPLLGSSVAGNQPAPSTAESSFHAGYTDAFAIHHRQLHGR